MSKFSSTQVACADSKALVDCAERRQQDVLRAIAFVNIQLTPEGLQISAPGIDPWEPDDDYAESFTELPTAFARSYLQLRLRNFLLETFCHPLPHDDAEKLVSESTLSLVNDEVGGGLNVGLIQQFLANNQGQGYFDPNWQVLRYESDYTWAVQKQSVTVHIEPNEHVRGEQQFAQIGDHVDILLPGYRYETDDYIAISNLGPVTETENAIEIYFAANAAAMAPIMTAVTTTLSDAILYTLRVPHRLSDYAGPEAIALRINGTDYATVLPVLQRIVHTCQAESKSTTESSNAIDPSSLAACPALRDECPVFAYPLYPGISWASVVDNSVTQWFGSAADVGRMQLIAEALVETWYDFDHNFSSSRKQIAALRAYFAEEGLSWSQPYRHLHQHWTSQWIAEAVI
ncbi:MAG: T3SS effector HopA1 family protein [Cyanobacteria bacterium P01_C01_bin.69]